MNTIETDTHAPQATTQLPSGDVLEMMEVALKAARDIMKIGNDILNPRRQEAAVLVTAILSAVDTLNRGSISS